MGHTLPFVNCQPALGLYGTKLRIHYSLNLIYQQKEAGDLLATQESQNLGVTPQKGGNSQTEIFIFYRF